MNKSALLLALALCSCQSVGYKDLNPEGAPNAALLPAMSPMVDGGNLKSAYSRGSSLGKTDSVGVGGGDVWGETTASVKTFYDDPRVVDVINIFEKEVKENITSPYGEKKGYVALKIGYRNDYHGWQYKIPSALTLYLVNLLGFPNDRIRQEMEVQVEIWNTRKEVLRRYTETVSDDEYVAMYWGYDSEDVRRKVAADNIKQALEKIRARIAADAGAIKKELN